MRFGNGNDKEPAEAEVTYVQCGEGGDSHQHTTASITLASLISDNEARYVGESCSGVPGIEVVAVLESTGHITGDAPYTQLLVFPSEVNCTVDEMRAILEELATVLNLALNVAVREADPIEFQQFRIAFVDVDALFEVLASSNPPDEPIVV